MGVITVSSKSRVATGEGYSRKYYESRENAFFRQEVKHLLTAAGVKPGTRVLELGCGGGNLLRACVRLQPARVVGMDMNRAGLRMAGRIAPEASTVMGDVTRLPFPDGSFDVIIAQHLIEHFEQPDGLLVECKRVLASGGRIAVATPNRLYPDSALFDDPTHCHIYTLSEAAETFRQAGMRVERAYSLMPFLFNRRFTWRLARLSMNGLLALRFLPFFRERGLTLIVSAWKGNEA